MENGKRVRFYCGMGVNKDGFPISHSAKLKVKEYLDTVFLAYTTFVGKGMWHGVEEQCWVFEVITDMSLENVRNVAHRLVGILDQSCVLVTFEPVGFSFVD